MTSVWFATSGNGEDGVPYDVHEVFATQEAAQAHCDRPDKPKWEHRYVQEWEVTGSLLTGAEREAVRNAAELMEEMWDKEPGPSMVSTLRGLLERLT